MIYSNIVGYVSKISNNAHTTSKSKFQKFTLSNNQGREVQVIGWNNLIDKIKEVKHTGQVSFSKQILKYKFQ